ncbi:putative DNA-binding domain-containing protein [Pelomonas sp. V22]|uniref:HvfC/BufC N-terminal domain-containing protein n=1 Tax=Pelomonas sp. V22 TaxID=2822139 RepID=UPI0024A8DF60|nr:DNA-binding domain-containing protein [Pelomonas sp. V22]MDI4634447.1 putative DNA-binding domain-containing protein [Pelomonas sp. V22]
MRDRYQQALQSAICSSMAAPGLLKPGSRLDVYANAYRARLIAALHDNHEVLYRAMGEEAFEALALAYLEAHPSPHRSIRWFGDGLAGFMAGAGAEQLDHPALIDIARMDWALRGAFDAADSEPLTAADLASLAPEDWPGLQLRLQAGTALLAMDWVIEPAWALLRAAESDTDLPELAAPVAGSHGLLVWRQGLETRWRALPPLEATLLEALQAGASFAALCEAAAQSEGEAAAAAAVVACLQQWLADELLDSRISVAEA